MTATIKHELGDGSVTTAAEVMERTGLSRIGAYRRLQLYINDVDMLFTRVGEIPRDSYVKSEWISEPVRIAWGIPINPEYLDGTTDGNTVYNRDGKVLTYAERVGLANYRDKLRKEWRASSTNIKNKQRR
tara:strand:+ start:1448 stop:1837 length:390 start_codon:yes stop_codon:yes gene_type:complete